MMLSRTYSALRFVTWNTRGVKNTRNLPKKFSDLLDRLNLGTDIAFIQETHVGPKCYKMLEDVKDWKVLFTVYSSRSKGVAILIKDSVPFEYICHDEDYSGSYIVLFCRLYGELFTLVNVYNHKADRNVLGRLKDYLMETAEGVLVVGGDFNTVLHPSFDRRPSAYHEKQSSLRAILEDFTASLNIRDTWSYLHATDQGFTRRQNESYSRLDMFFMPMETMKRECNINIQSDGISDHDPLVLNITVQKQTGNKIPNVASMLKEFRYNPDRRPGKINGVEILSAIKSLTDSEEQRPDTLEMDYYKRFQCPMTEILKIKYNLMLKNKELPEAFKEYHCSGDRYTFNVDYLIFSRILAKRLSAFITPSFKGRRKTKLDTLLIMTFETHPTKIRWSFLEQSLRNLKQITYAPPPDFSILECLLPKVQSSSGELRRLQHGCPLTNTILNLALMQLEDLILKTQTECTTSVCYHRQALFIHAQSSRHHTIVKIVEKYKEDSGIKIKMSVKQI